MKALKLVIDGKEKTFTVPFTSGLIWRKYIELKAKTENLANLQPEEMDEFCSLVVLTFNNQFTLDEYYAGIPFEKMLNTIDWLFLPDEKGGAGNEKK